MAAAHRVEPHEHRNLLRGELDWITMRAIEKDRNRRYSSPADLAADLSRHLRDEPVLAGPPSQWYRAKKLVARHRTVAAFVSLLMISLIAGIATTMWQARVAKRERTAAVEQRTLAEKRTADIRKLASTLIFDIDGAIQNAGPTKAREQLAETAREYLDQLSAESPDDGLLKDVVNGYLRLGIVQYYPGFAHLGQPVAAEASFAKGLDLAKKRYAANAGESYAHADVGRLHIYHARAPARLESTRRSAGRAG